MKRIPKAVQALLRENPDLQEMMINAFKSQKGQDYIKSTVSLPLLVVSEIEKIKKVYGVPPQMTMQQVVKLFMHMERTYTEAEDKNDYNEILRTVRDHYLIDTFFPDDLEKKSYYMDKRDAKNLSLIAKASSISRNELISWGVLMIADKLKQFDEAYERHVTKYKKEFEGVLHGIQALKNSAIKDLGNRNDEIVLMVGRMESQLQLHLMYIDKYQKDGIWNLGAVDTKNQNYFKLLQDIYAVPPKKMH